MRVVESLVDIDRAHGLCSTFQERYGPRQQVRRLHGGVY